MRWIYLSPHFDDVALSCGGMVWQQVRAGQVLEAWTICAGAPAKGGPLSGFARSLHKRWKTGVEAVPIRLQEDEAAMHRLGVQFRYWDLLDCIYRHLPDGSWLVNDEPDLWKPVHPKEAGVVAGLRDWLVEGLSPSDRLVSPLTLGNHVDHSLVRAAAEQAADQVGCSVWYYPDYPYAVRPNSDQVGKVGTGWQKVCQPISDEGLRAWQEVIACYESQISTFWSGRAAMNAALRDYWQKGGGSCLWQPASGKGE